MADPRDRAGSTRRPTLPFQRLSESERLARDLEALVQAGLIAPVEHGAETRYESVSPEDCP